MSLPLMTFLMDLVTGVTGTDSRRTLLHLREDNARIMRRPARVGHISCPHHSWQRYDPGCNRWMTSEVMRSGGPRYATGSKCNGGHSTCLPRQANRVLARAVCLPDDRRKKRLLQDDCERSRMPLSLPQRSRDCHSTVAAAPSSQCQSAIDECQLQRSSSFDSRPSLHLEARDMPETGKQFHHQPNACIQLPSRVSDPPLPLQQESEREQAKNGEPCGAPGSQETKSTQPIFDDLTSMPLPRRRGSASRLNKIAAVDAR